MEVSQQIKMKNKKAAMEMSMGMIVTIVLLVSVLILGLVFVRNIMCKSILITDDITASLEGEIKNLFGTTSDEIICVGEGEANIKIGADGSSKKLGCVINTQSSGEYTFTVASIKSLKGESVETVKSWFLSGKEGDNKPFSILPPGGNANFIVIQPDKKTSLTTVEIEVKAMDPNGRESSHYMVFDVSAVGAISSAIC